MRLHIVGLLYLFSLSVDACGPPVACAQATATSPTVDYQQRLSKATSWQRTAVVPATENKDNAEARGLYFDMQVGAAQPLDSTPIVGSTGIGHTFSGPSKEEFPVAGADSIVVGTFSKYSVFLTPSHRSIYTELQFVPKAIVKSNANGRTSYPVLIPGGTVSLPLTGQKRTISCGIEDSRYVLSPNSTYLLFLRYHREGDFFTLRRSWQVVNGALTPNNAVDERNAKNRLSKHYMQPLDAAIAEVQSTP